MKTHSLSQKLFRTYAGWFAAYLIILACISVGYLAYNERKNIRDTQEQLMKSINENVENYFEKMNNFSLELLNSKEFKEVAMRELPEEFEEGKSTSKLFSKLYNDAYKMIPFKYNIGVVLDDEYYIWMGRYYYINRIGENEIHTYDDMVRNELPVIQYLESNEYLKKTSLRTGTNESYITLSRSMGERKRYLNGRAILEIHVEKQEFINEMSKFSLKESGSDLKINIYDAKGNAVYQENEKDLSKYVNVREKKVFQGEGESIAVRKIFDDNLTIVYTRDAKIYYKEILQFWIITLSLCAFIIGILVWMTYKLSKQISKPIHSMCEHVYNINLKDGIGYEEITTDITELQFLSQSLKQMSTQIEESLQQIITLKDYEVHAKMMALQAQMQPHFLFNTLSTIASMADAEGNRKIYRICMNLNSMFRYIAAESSEGVRMFEEIRHIESYVDIMKERFPESTVKIDIPLEMMDCRIPKLTIQPLVENAFKYCNRDKPDIQVIGVMEEDGGKWTVEVSDNGKGFSAEKKEEIMNKCQEGLKSEKTLPNQIDGMGLVNVYVRMKLFYGENMSYFIEENKGRIVIGGIKDERDKKV